MRVQNININNCQKQTNYCKNSVKNISFKGVSSDITEEILKKLDPKITSERINSFLDFIKEVKLKYHKQNFFDIVFTPIFNSERKGKYIEITKTLTKKTKKQLEDKFIYPEKEIEKFDIYMDSFWPTLFYNILLRIKHDINAIRAIFTSKLKKE